jgi:hypothetical protein
MNNNNPNAFHDVPPAELSSVEGGAPVAFHLGRIGIAIGNVLGGESGGAVGWTVGSAIGRVVDAIVGPFRP